MKLFRLKLISAALLLSSFFAKAQEPAQPLGSQTGAVKTLGRHYIDSAAILPLRDTTYKPLRAGAFQTLLSTKLPYHWDGFGFRRLAYFSDISSGATALSDLTDVNLSTLSDGQIIQYDFSTSKWVNVDAVDNSVSSEPDWSVINILNTPPGSPATGEIYLAGTSPTGGWVANNIETWNGASWDATAPTTGQQLYNQLTSDNRIYRYTGSSWIPVTQAVINQNGNRFGVDMIIGTNDAKFLRLRTNGANRMSFSSTGTPTINSLTGAAAGIVGASTTGQLSNVQKGYGVNITSSSISVDTFAIETRARGLKLVDSLVSVIGSSGSASKFGKSGEDDVAAENRDFDADGHDIIIHGAGSLTFNDDDITEIESVNTGIINSLDSQYVTAVNALYEKGGYAHYLALNRAFFGSASSSGDSTGITTWAGGEMRFINVPAYSSGTGKFIWKDGTSDRVFAKSITASDITSGNNLSVANETNVGLSVTSGTGTGATLQNLTITPTWSGTLAQSRGGTGFGTYTTGDILYSSASNTLSKLAIGSSTQILTVSGGVPTWQDAPGGATAANPTGSIGLSIVNGSASTFMRSDGHPSLDQSIAPTWTGVHTWNVNSNDAISMGGTKTFTANNQRWMIVNPSVTLRATASDVGIGMELSPTITSGAATQTAVALKINPTFTTTGGAFSNQIAIQHAGDIVPVTSNTAKLGGSSIAYSSTFALTTNTGTISFQNATAAPSSTLTFTNGQGTGSTMVANGHQIWGEGNNGTGDDSSQLHAKGGVEFNGIYLPKLAAETISSITNTGVAGSTTYTYIVAAYCFNGTASVSAAVSTTTGNATLNGSNFNVITWTQVVGAYRYDIYRTVGGATQGKIIAKNQGSTTINDNGLTGDGATAPTASLNNTGSIKIEGGIIQPATITAGGTTGAQTINKLVGCVNFAASATSLVVTDNFVTTTSIVNAWCQTADANKTAVYAIVPASGSFTINVDPAPAAETKVCFEVKPTF
jgi:hypothetical protein